MNVSNAPLERSRNFCPSRAIYGSSTNYLLQQCKHKRCCHLRSSLALKVKLPSVGLVRTARQFSRDVLPALLTFTSFCKPAQSSSWRVAPDGPMIARSSPGSAKPLTLLRMRFSSESVVVGSCHHKPWCNGLRNTTLPGQLCHQIHILGTSSTIPSTFSGMDARATAKSEDCYMSKHLFQAQHHSSLLGLCLGSRFSHFCSKASPYVALRQRFGFEPWRSCDETLAWLAGVILPPFAKIEETAASVLPLMTTTYSDIHFGNPLHGNTGLTEMSTSWSLNDTSRVKL